MTSETSSGDEREVNLTRRTPGKWSADEKPQGSRNDSAGRLADRLRPFEPLLPQDQFRPQWRCAGSPGHRRGCLSLSEAIGRYGPRRRGADDRMSGMVCRSKRSRRITGMRGTGPRPKERRMTARPRPRLSLSLNGLSMRQLAYQTCKRMAGHDAMIWAAAIAFYALFATVPLLALFLLVTVLRLPDLTGAGGRTSGLG